MGDSIDLSEEIAAGDHSTGRALFNMTKKNGAQLGYAYMGYLDQVMTTSYAPATLNRQCQNFANQIHCKL